MPARAIKTGFITILAIGLLASSAVGVAAHDEEDPMGPPGSEHLGGGAMGIEEGADPESAALAHLFVYKSDVLWTDEDGIARPQGAFTFASDEDWYRNARAVNLKVGTDPGLLAACLD